MYLENKEISKFVFFPALVIDVSDSYSVCSGPLRKTRPLLACMYCRWWVLDGVYFVLCHLMWGDGADALCPMAWLWRQHVWAPLCCDYVGRARRLLIRLWEGACL